MPAYAPQQQQFFDIVEIGARRQEQTLLKIILFL